MQTKRRQIIVYPFLFAVYPLLHLYATNIELMAFSEILLPLALILGATAVLYLAVNWSLKANTRAGVITTAIAFAALYYGYYYDEVFRRISPDPNFVNVEPRHNYLLPLWIIFFVFIIALAVWKLNTQSKVDGYLNFLSVVLVVMALIPVAQSYFDQAKASEHLVEMPTPTKGRSLNSRVRLDALPDVYYIILDGYARGDVLRDYYDFDNSAFINYLTSNGFYVASESHSNYAQTSLSIPSSLNIDYLDNLGVLEDKLSDREKTNRLTFLAHENYLTRQFNDLGYTTIHFGSEFRLTNYSEQADINHPFRGRSEFTKVFLGTTIYKAFDLFTKDRREGILDTFSKLKEVPKIKDPTFTFAHIVAPHPPYVFDREGNFTGVEYYENVNGNVWLPKQAYTDQLSYVNHLTEDLIDSILAQSETPPIIVLQADHGTWSGWIKSREALPIFNAYYLPGGGEQYLYPSITPVNSFRLILDFYFGTDLGLLEDRSYISSYVLRFDMCESDGIFPDITDPDIWALSTTRALEEHNYRLSVEDCDFEKLLQANDGFHNLERSAGYYHRWAGPSLYLQFPVEVNQDYIFRAWVRYGLSDENQEVRLLIDGELIDSTTAPLGDGVITFFIPAERIHTKPFVKVLIEHSNQFKNLNGDPRVLSLAYHWIEWVPSSKLLGVSQAGPANHPLVMVDPSLTGTVGIDPQLQTPPWGIEVYDDASLLWLGYGEEQGLGGTFWATERQAIRAIFEVEPGPARPDAQRTVEVVLQNQAGTQRARRQFDQATDLTFIGELQPGRNDFQFIVLDEATILEQPNGDTRPLLVLLRQITVKPLTED